MKVKLLKDIKLLGAKGEVKEVSDEKVLNFLIKRQYVEVAVEEVKKPKKVTKTDETN